MKDNGFLYVVFVSHYFVLIGELFVLNDGCQRGDAGVRERRLLHFVAVEHGFVDEKAHFGFLEDEV